jgi:hypothetical protein
MPTDRQQTRVQVIIKRPYRDWLGPVGWGGDALPWIKRLPIPPDPYEDPPPPRQWTPADVAGGWGGDQVPWIKRIPPAEIPTDEPLRKLWGPNLSPVGWGGDQGPWLRRPLPVDIPWEELQRRLGYPFTALVIPPITDQAPWIHRLTPVEIPIDEPSIRKGWAAWLATVGWGGDHLPWVKRIPIAEMPVDEPMRRLWGPNLSAVGWGGEQGPWLRRLIPAEIPWEQYPVIPFAAWMSVPPPPPTFFPIPWMKPLAQPDLPDLTLPDFKLGIGWLFGPGAAPVPPTPVYPAGPVPTILWNPPGIPGWLYNKMKKKKAEEELEGFLIGSQ